MRDFLTNIAVIIGLFWRSFTRTTIGAIVLATGVIIGINLLVSTALLLLTKEIVIMFFMFQLFAFAGASLAWFMILSGRGMLFTVAILLASLAGGLNFPIPEIKVAGILAVGMVLVLLCTIQKDEIKLFLFDVHERLKEKNKIVDKWMWLSNIPQCDILLLMASSGSGHIVAAKNIAAKIEELAPSKKIACINVFDYLDKKSRDLQEAYWEYLATYTPGFYRPIHRFILWDFKNAVKRKAKIAATQIQEKLHTTPSIMVATHPMAVAIGSALKEITGSKLVVVPTDYYVHSHYTTANVDLYCLPSKECFYVGLKKEEILNKSIITGMPIAVEIKEIEKEEAKKKLELDANVPVVFVNFGGAGIMRPKIQIELMSLLIFCSIPCQFLLSKATNEILGNIAELSKRFGNAICIVVDDTRLAFSASDVMIGKVGGLSISEAINCGIPIGIWTHAGPEDFNAKFLIKSGYGIKVGGFWELLLDFPKMKKWILSCASEHRVVKESTSVQKIAEATLNL